MDLRGVLVSNWTGIGVVVNGWLVVMAMTGSTSQDLCG